MRRYDYDDNDDFQDEVDNFFSELDEEEQQAAQDYAEMMQRREVIDLLQLELVQKDLDQRLLFRVMKMLEKGFFWRFRSYKSKLVMIAETYTALKLLIEPAIIEEKEEAHA